MNKIFLWIILFVAFIFPIQAQNILKGVVHDESGISISSTTVRILTGDSIFVSGEITDDNGYFLIKNVKAGKYILAISNVGYISQFVDFEMTDKEYTLPLITLKIDNIVLNGIEIKGSSVIYKKDHLLIIPDKQQVKHAFSGYDLLYNLMIPGLNVDRKSKTVMAATGTATLYINGVKATFREVQNLRPKDIEKVEYYSMPTGKYVGDAASINYLTKIDKTGGYITLEGEQFVGYLNGNYDLAAKLSHNNTNYTFFGGYNMKGYNGVKKEKNEELFFQDYTINRNRTTDNADFKNNQQYAQFKISNDTKKHNLSGQLSFVGNKIPHNDLNEILTYSGQNEQRIYSFENIYSESLKPAISLNGIFNLKEKHQLKVELNGSYTQNKYSRNYTEEEQKSFTNADENLYSFDAYSQYIFRPDSKSTLSGSFSHYHNITSSLYSGDYNSWQHLWKGESLFFANYARDFGEKVTMLLNPGCSILNYKLHGNKLQRFVTFRANTWVRYRINSKHWILGGFSMGNYQPDISSLNSLDQTIDFYQIRRGNPNLGNTKVYSCGMMYEGQIKAFNIHTMLELKKYDHNIYPDYFLEGNKLISSYRSDGSFNTANINMSISYRITENLRANLRLKYNYMYVPNKSGLNQQNFTASMDMNYFLKSFTINVYAKTQEKALDSSTLAFMRAPASYGLSARYNNKRWMAEIGTENPFTKHVHYQESGNYGVYKYNQVLTSRIYQQIGYIKLAYTVDFGKKTSRENMDVNRTINSAILKTE